MALSSWVKASFRNEELTMMKLPNGYLVWNVNECLKENANRDHIKG